VRFGRVCRHCKPRESMKKRPKRLRQRPPSLTIAQILQWADAYFQRTGNWPTARAGVVTEALGENWRKLDNALRYGLRGLPAGSSLARLLAEHRGVRNVGNLPPLSEGRILAWALAHFSRVGKWPAETCSSGVHEAPGEIWRNIDAALRGGTRGLAGGSSLAKLIATSASGTGPVLRG